MPPGEITHPKHSKKIIIALIAICAFALTYFTATHLARYFVYNISTVSAEQNGMQNNEPAPVPVLKNTLSVQFFGDMMFDRGVRAQINQKGSDLVFASGTKALVQDFDFTIANLEGPITTYPSKTMNTAGKGIPGFSFTFPTSTASLIKESGIDMVSLANNHTDNFGPEGLKQAVRYLSQNNMEYFGNPTNTLNMNASGTALSKDLSPMTAIHCFTEGFIKKQCIALIGYHEFTHQNENLILDQIRNIKDKVNYVIVMPHWGDEYKNEPNQKQKNLAHQWIDAGADMIVGAHPHVIESIEQYQGKYIFYSLGNYMFDQYFSYDTTHAITAGFHFEISPDSNRLVLKKINLVPVDITNVIVRKANDLDTTKILLKQSEISKKYVPAHVFEGIQKGEILVN